MVDIRAFHGWRYNPEKVDLAQVLAPPYDVVTPGEQRAFLAKSPYNVFHLELGEDAPGEDRYIKARRLWEEWRQKGILRRDSSPALYLYQLRFSWQGQRMVRRGFIALVRLFPWEEKKILPHEKTFDRVTQDRLQLLRATRAQFSQIFCLYHDPDLRSVEALASAASPVFSVLDEEGFEHELSLVTQPEVIGEVRRLLSQDKLYIADGHHRYTTALRFMREMEEIYGREPLRCFHYMMMYLCPFEEPGLLVLPTHRLLELSLSREELFRRLRDFGRFEPLASSSLEEVLKTLSPLEFLVVHEGEVFRFRLNEGAARLTEHLPPEIFRLPVAVFTSVMTEALGLEETLLKEEGRLTYTPWVDQILKEARGKRFGFLLARTPVLALEEVARAGLVMPHKSTYFFPKILTGTVFFEIDPEKSPPC